MKKPTDNMNKSRREALGAWAAWGVVSLLPEFLIPSLSEAMPFHFVGLGGAGANLVELVHRKGAKGRFTCITHPIRPHLPEEIDFIHFRTPGQGIYKQGDEITWLSDMSRPLVMPESVLRVFESHEVFVLFSGLGGYTGTFMTVELTRMLRQKEKTFHVISALPFRFEGKMRRELAEQAAQRLKKIPSFHGYDLEHIRREYGNRTIQDSIEKANENLYEMLITKVMG